MPTSSGAGEPGNGRVESPVTPIVVPVAEQPDIRRGHRPRPMSGSSPGDPGDRERRDPRSVMNRLGRGLRFLAGVDEALMDKVHWERASYASLGGVVLGTATIAGFSMWFAVHQATDPGPLGALLPATIWFLFILIVDRWIVTTRPTGAWQRWVLLLSRGFIAVLFGVVIAEPLVLRVFQTQIEEQVRADRITRLAFVETRLLACNPNPADPQAPPAPGDCRSTGDSLSIADDPGARAHAVTQMEAEVKALRERIARDAAELQRLNDLAAAECVGASGPGLTGRWGEGVNCRTRRAQATEYANTHPIGEQQRQLAEMEKNLVGLRSETTSASTDFQLTRDEALRRRLSGETPVDAPIGLLERMNALSKLGQTSSTLWLGIILVRLLFITIDCAPVLMKVTSGTSRYDDLVTTSLDDAVKSHRLDLAGNDEDREIRKEEREQRRRAHGIEMAKMHARAVEARAAEYERQAMAGQDPA